MSTEAGAENPIESLNPDKQQAQECKMVPRPLNLVTYAASTTTTDRKVTTPSSMNGHFLTEIDEISNSSDFQDYRNIDFDTSGIGDDLIPAKFSDVSPRVLGTIISDNCETLKSIKEIGKVPGKA